MAQMKAHSTLSQIISPHCPLSVQVQTVVLSLVKRTPTRRSTPSPPRLVLPSVTPVTMAAVVRLEALEALVLSSLDSGQM